MFAVELKIAIDSPHAAVGNRLGHAHQAGVGKGHWALAVATHQIPEAAMLVITRIWRGGGSRGRGNFWPLTHTYGCLWVFSIGLTGGYGCIFRCTARP